LELVFWFCLC